VWKHVLKDKNIVMVIYRYNYCPWPVLWETGTGII